MRMVRIDNLQPGMKLGEAVFSESGQVLLGTNAELSASYINRLKNHGLQFVYIDDADSVDIKVDNMIPIQLHQEVYAKVRESYQEMSNPRNMEKFVKAGKLGPQFENTFKMLFEYLRDHDTVITQMGTIFTNDSYLYTHSLNVGMYTAIMGIANGLSDGRIKDLGVGAMLHDIGKLSVPREILDKPGKLNDEERKEIEKHCEYGYQILRQQHNVSIVSAQCAYQHHERWDGTGYPRHLKGEAIHQFGRIMSVVDVYDALTANRVYRKGYLPSEALEFLYTGSGTQFDPRYVEMFRNHVNLYPVGMTVMLSNGLSGIVSRTNRDSLQRPVVRILWDQGNKVFPYELDLSSTLNATIVACDMDLEKMVLDNRETVQRAA